MSDDYSEYATLKLIFFSRQNKASSKFTTRQNDKKWQKMAKMANGKWQKNEKKYRNIKRFEKQGNKWEIRGR